ncbi:MAG: acyltransferase family protein, partial [Gemmatimonas sp.]
MKRFSFVEDAVLDLRNPPDNQNPALDALRTLAILMVIAGHFPEVGKAQFPRYAQLLGSPIFNFGWTGVDLFFVLSGLLIGRQLWKEHLRTGTVNVPRFIARRGFRIWPLYLFIAIISPALDDKWSYKWPDWVFLSNYFSGRVEGGWSLSTEEQFYILAPLAIFACARYLRTRGLFAALAALLVVVSAARWWTAHALLGAGDSVEKVKTAMYTPFHLHSEGLVIGLIIALASVVSPHLLDGSRPTRLRVCGVAALVCVVALMLRAMNGIVFPFLSLAMIYGSVTIALLSIGTSNLGPLKARAFYVLSRISYGMYLNHFAVLRWIAPSVARVAKTLGGQNPVTLLMTMSSVVAISASFALVTFIAIEHPFLALRERIWSARTRLELAPSMNAGIPAPARGLPFADLSTVPRRERVATLVRPSP